MAPTGLYQPAQLLFKFQSNSHLAKKQKLPNPSLLRQNCTFNKVGYFNVGLLTLCFNLLHLAGKPVRYEFLAVYGEAARFNMVKTSN